MKRKFEKITTFGLGLLMGGMMFATTTDAASLVKNLRATYNNIKVTFDGQRVTPSKEPFMIDGTVYVSLRDAGQITGNGVTWSNNTVQITSSGQANMGQYEQEIISKNFQIAQLQAQLSQAQQKIALLEIENEYAQEDIADALEEICESYEKAYSGNLNIDWEIDFVERSNSIELTLTYESSSDQRRYTGARTSKVEDFLEMLCEEIVDIAHVKVEGEIVDYVNRKTVVADFTYSTSGRLSLAQESLTADIEDLEEEIYYDYRRDLPKFVITGDVLYKDSIDLEQVTIEERRNGTADFILEVDFTAAQEEDWNTVGIDDGKVNERDFLRMMREIAEDIAYELDIYEEDVFGYIYANDELIIAYEDDKLKLYYR